MKIAIIGSGDVAQTLGEGFLRHGHDVVLGTRDVSKLADWVKANPKGRAGGVAAAAQFAEVAVLAVKGSAAADAMRAAGAGLKGKVVIDATNPTKDEPPEHGVLKFFTTHDQSLMERLQLEFAGVKFVKAFNAVGVGCMVNPQFAGGKPTMFICGNDEAGKSVVTKILDEFGWETMDMGPAIAARAIEPLCLLWCIPGFTKNDWVHAFKMLR